MAKVKVSDLEDAALDWAVAKCEGHNVCVLTVEEQRQRYIESVGKEPDELDEQVISTFKPEIRVLSEDGYKRVPYHSEALMVFAQGIPAFEYSKSWAQGGPIITREHISTSCDAALLPHFKTYKNILWEAHTGTHADYENRQWGPTALIAAMRCYVASKLGEEIEVPDELLK